MCCICHILQLVYVRVDYLQQSLAGRSARACSTITYAHKVYAQRSLDAKVAIIKTLNVNSPLEGDDVVTVSGYGQCPTMQNKNK